MPDLLLAVDGGGSKTYLALFEVTGRLLALVHGPSMSPQVVGLGGSLRMLQGLRDKATQTVGVATTSPTSVAAFALHGLDLPEEEAAFREASSGWAARTWVGNDVFAILRAGSSTGWGVAVAAGSGMNAVGVHPDGRVARFLALGALSGDWAAAGTWATRPSAQVAGLRTAAGRTPD